MNLTPLISKTTLGALFLTVSQISAAHESCLYFEREILFAQNDTTDEIPMVTSMEEGLNLTPVFVEVDPLGAKEDVPWLVHRDSIDIHAQPSTESRVVGTVSQGVELYGEYCIIEESDEEWLKLKGFDGWVIRTALNRVHPLNSTNLQTHENLPIGQEVVNRWWGIPIDYEANDLVEIPTAYTSRERDDMFLRKEALEAAMKLVDASRLAGEEVQIASPYRSGTRQQQIYHRNVGRNPAQRSSAPPGHSEHQLGLTIDFSNPITGRFLRNTDSCHKWMTENAPKFGFRQTYLADNTEETGYIEEPWHWRYIGVENAMQEGWTISDVIH